MIDSVPTYICNYCKKSFVRERTLLSHMCEKKRRHFNKDEKYVQLGFNAWKLFYKLTGSSIGKEKTYKDFIGSNHYIAFTKFGKHILNTNMVNPDQFIPFVIKNHIRLDDWCKDSIFEEYVRKICRKEDVNTALERQIKIMMKWAENNDENWVDYFKNIDIGIAYKLITTGHLSPWLLLNSDEVEKNLFTRFSDEQFMHVADFINFDFWKIKMAHESDDTLFVKSVIEDIGI